MTGNSVIYLWLYFSSSKSPFQGHSRSFQTIWIYRESIQGSDFENGSYRIRLGYIKWTCLFVFGPPEFLWCNNLELKSRSCWIINTIILILQNKLNFRNPKYPNSQILLPNTVCFWSLTRSDMRISNRNDCIFAAEPESWLSLRYDFGARNVMKFIDSNEFLYLTNWILPKLSL